MFPLFMLSEKTWLAVGAIALAAGSFIAGAMINGWRLDAKHTKAMSEKDAQISDMSQKIVTQNAAVDTLYQRSQDAELRRKQAAEIHKQTLQGIDKRIEATQKSQATDCEGVLKEAHEDVQR